MNLALAISLNTQGSRRRPDFSIQPGITGMLQAGQILTLTTGTAGPGPVSYDIIRLRLDGVNKMPELADMAWDTSGEDVSAGGIIAYRVRAYGTDGSRLSDEITAVLTPDPAAPVFTTQPAVAGLLQLGEVLTLSLGVAGPALTSQTIETFTLDGIDQRPALSGLVWDTTGLDISGGGAIVLQTKARNAAGGTLSDLVTATLAPLPPATWTLADNAAGGFAIIASQPNSPAPVLADTGSGAAQIGAG